MRSKSTKKVDWTLTWTSSMIASPIDISVLCGILYVRSQGCLHEAAEMARTSLAFFSVTEELTIAAWDAVDAKWDEVPRSYAPARHTFMALRAVLFQIQDIVQGHIVDIIWSFVSGFKPSYTIHWNDFEVFKPIGVFFAWSFNRSVAWSFSRMLMSHPTKA